MKKQKTQNTNKGITLIALVITIIVMLILVAVTITMAVNGGLFEYAGKAGTKTNEAIANEQLLASGQVRIDNEVYNSIDEYLLGDGKVVLSDDYGHKYTVEEPGKYYFYSYTYGQNFMTLFEVTEENNKLIANKLGVYSNETGVSREDALAGDWKWYYTDISSLSTYDWGTAVLLGDVSELANVALVGLNYPSDYGESGASFYLTPGYYICEFSPGTIYEYVINQNFDVTRYEYSQYCGDEPPQGEPINLHEFAQVSWYG